MCRTKLVTGIADKGPSSRMAFLVGSVSYDIKKMTLFYTFRIYTI